MMDDKISIIVPIYNVEQYLNKGIQSLCDQTYSNIEIILVDDGSTDSSGGICDSFAKKDSRIKVLHIKNGGQSHARNIGLSIATGNIIGFMDGDDYASLDMYKTMVHIMQANNADIVECNFNGRKCLEKDVIEENKLILDTGKIVLQNQLNPNTVSRYPSTSVWSKIFRREILEGCVFPEGKIHEEFLFLCKAFCQSKNYAYINTRLYNRVLREDSTTAAKFSLRTLDKLDVYRERNEYLKEINENELWEMSKSSECMLMLHYYNELRRNQYNSQAVKIRKELIENYKYFFANRGTKRFISFKKKTMYFLIVNLEWIYRKII